MLLQNQEFYEVQLKEISQQLIDTKKAHEVTLKAFEIGNIDSNAKGDKNYIIDMKDKHSKELKQLEYDFENLKKKNKIEIENLMEKLEDLELNSKIKDNDFKKEKEMLNDSLEKMEEHISKLNNDIKNLELGKERIIKENEERNANQMKFLEAELEEYKNRSVYEGRDMQAKSEHEMNLLKGLFEEEKAKLEKVNLFSLSY